MPLQNRVDPWGQFQAVSAHGALMGNRGILHNEKKEIVSQWEHSRWVTCTLKFPGVQRILFSPRNYSELFFLDEATAFSAGHRPCAQCRREKFNEFKSAWLAANLEFLPKPRPRIEEVDEKIHADRATKSGGKVTYQAPVGSLPDGAIVEVDRIALLVWRGALLPWSFDGYGPIKDALPPQTVVRVLTPASVVRAFASGFTPEVHPSANVLGLEKSAT